MIGGILSPETVSSKRKATGNLGRIIKTANRKRICLENDERSMNFFLILTNNVLKNSSLQILKYTSKGFRI